jgi:exoenzyme U
MKVSGSIFQVLPPLPYSLDQPSDTSLVEGVGPRKLSLYRDRHGGVEVVLSPPAPGHLVLSGGGAKGVAFSGVVQALEDGGKLQGIKAVSGSSAGAISGVLLASGMGGKAFDTLSDHIDLPGLLNSHDAVTAWLQDASSSLGKLAKCLPGPVGNISQLLLTMMPRLQTEAPQLVEMMRNESRKSILAHIADTPRATRPAELMKIADRLSAGGAPTFGDLEVLNRFIPAIKQLNVTGTAMFDGRPQLVVFNASLTPDMDIARAAHISGSLPVLFKSPIEQGHGFQESSEVTAFRDGGLLVNTPAPDIIDRSFAERALNKDEALIVQFESEKPGMPQKSGGFFSHLVDTFTNTPHTAAEAYQDERLSALADQTVTLPLNTNKGDFRGLLNGTVNFTLTPEQKDYLQALASETVVAHLERRDTAREHHQFASLEGALLAMDDDVIASVQDHLKNQPAAVDVLKFRTDAHEALRVLDGAITDANQSEGALLLTPKMTSALRNLDALARQPEHIEWLGRRLNAGGQRNFQQLLQVSAKHASDKTPMSKVMTRAVAEMQKRDIATKAENFTREVIYPSQYRPGQPEANVELLQAAASDLAKATTPAAFNRVLDGIIQHYEVRNKPWSKPFSSTTVEQAKAWRIPV